MPAEAPYQGSLDEVLGELDVALDEGLTESEAGRRRERYGENRLRRYRARPLWRILVDQVASLVVLLLLAASAVAALFGRALEAVAIGAALLVNTVVGFFMEWRATRSMESLQQMGRVQARVRRDGREARIPAARLVPGDVCLLEPGDVVPADLRLAETNRLRCDEAALTGESEPAGKDADETYAQEVPLGDRRNMAWKGTAVVDGSGVGVVAAIGRDTELGRISELVETAEAEATPLEKRLEKLGGRLVWLTLAIAAATTAAGIAAGKEVAVMLETSLALAIAAVPEGLPVVATLALARGMQRMARRNAVVKRLSAVEALGAVNLILTDKTGTLTENRMTLSRLALADDEVEIRPDEDGALDAWRDNEAADLDDVPGARRALEVGALCNNASVDDGDAVGDPTEVALAAAAGGLHRSRSDLLEEMPEEREVSFDPDVKMMATFHRMDDGFRVAVKGAPEALLEHCTRVRTADGTRELDEDGIAAWQQRAETMAEQGLRVLALAEKRADDPEAEPYGELTLLALAGLYDPPRQGIAEVMDACRRAGIRVVMVTGDHLATARAIAAEIGLVDKGGKAKDASSLGELSAADDETRDELMGCRVFARISPEQKLELARLHQEEGAIVGMTGDGVNDAPALKRADIGVAMGQRGTQVAKETADIVLTDDAFGTIVTAIAYGRTIFDNIRRFIVYLLSGNLAEIMAVSAAAAVAAPLPLLPLQILYINFVSDVMPALALGLVPGSEDALERRPRRTDEALLTRRHWGIVTAWGLLMAVTVLAAFATALEVFGMSAEEAVGISFLCFGFTRLWHVFNMRRRRSGVFVNEVVRSPVVWLAIVIGIALLLAAAWLPGLSTVLIPHAPDARGWGIVLGFSLIPLLLGQLLVSVGWLATVHHGETGTEDDDAAGRDGNADTH
jgi:Ca2+-transporting ATPase